MTELGLSSIILHWWSIQASACTGLEGLFVTAHQCHFVFNFQLQIVQIKAICVDVAFDNTKHSKGFV